MIHTYKLFVKKHYPAHLSDAVDKLSKACDAVFANTNSLTILCAQVHKELNEKLSEGERAYVRINVDEKRHGIVELYAAIDGHVQAVLWLDFCEVQAVLDFDQKAKSFFDISEDMEDLFTKGGNQ